MIKFLRVFIFLILFLFFSSKEILAASVSVSNVPSSLDKDQEFTVLVNISGAASNTNNYLRGVFYSSSSATSYFGYTFNNSSNWYNGSPSPIDSHQFFQIQIGADGTWSGEIKAKADIESPYFKGNGEYYFKIGRYTANGTSVSDWSTPFLTSISFPTATFTPTPTLRPTATSKPSPTEKPTSTSKLLATQAIKLPTDSNALLVSSKKEISSTDREVEKSATDDPNSVLGEKSEKSPTPSSKETKVLSTSENNFSKIFIGIGIVLLAVCGILAFVKFRNKNYGE